MAIVRGATYVARAFSGKQKHMVEMFKGAIQHKGFALVDVFSPCVTYNKDNTYQWFNPRVKILADEDFEPVLRVIQEEHFATNATIVSENSPGTKLYIVKSGTVDVLKKRPMSWGTEETRIARLTEGEFFGELSVFDKRLATIATQSCMVVKHRPLPLPQPEASRIRFTLATAAPWSTPEFVTDVSPLCSNVD
jgi:Cyclic nucleotide-binding domain/Pyruvate ferredoxin oxidoreductase beta subunit C terminal